MNTQNTKKMMKTINLWKSTLILTAMLAVLFPILGEAGPMGKYGPLEQAGPLLGQLVGRQCLSVKTRPLSDFLNAQGTLNDPPQFFPPVKDYSGWADAVDPNTQLPTTFALVDYAGIANKYIKAQTGHSLGTEMQGSVIECKLSNNTAKITVALFTTKALGFAQSIQALANNNFDFLITPTIFGAKAKDVVNGADAAVGPVTLLTTFIVQKDSNGKFPLPDFLDVVNNSAKYAPVTFNFTSITFGKCANGKRAGLNVHQVAATNDKNPPELVFSKETVDAGC